MLETENTYCSSINGLSLTRSFPDYKLHKYLSIPNQVITVETVLQIIVSYVEYSY